LKHRRFREAQPLVDTGKRRRTFDAGCDCSGVDHTGLMRELRPGLVAERILLRIEPVDPPVQRRDLRDAFGRSGGGHVGFVVGESASNLYILGGNQSNAVNIMPIAKTRLIATRWPASLPAGSTEPPRMSGGAISANEA
jgi:hypothetical protein